MKPKSPRSRAIWVWIESHPPVTMAAICLVIYLAFRLVNRFLPWNCFGGN